jgi:hypothetical protein
MSLLAGGFRVVERTHSNMKKLIIALLLSAGATAPGLAATEATFTPLIGDPVVALDAETLDYLTSRTRVTVGMQRGTVVDQMGEPNVMLHPDVWVFKNFHASNVFGAEKFDTLFVIFKDNKVAKITLTNEKTIRAAALRQKEAAAKARAVAAK